MQVDAIISMLNATRRIYDARSLAMARFASLEDGYIGY